MICPLIQDECLEDDCAWFVDGECAIAIIAAGISGETDEYNQEILIQKMKEKW